MAEFWETENGPVSGTDLVAEVVNLYPEAADFLQSVGMHCIGCAAAHGESLYDACRIHGLSGAKVVQELNRVIAG